MQIIVSPRQNGKTTKIVKWLLEDQKRVLMVGDEKTKKLIIRHFPEARMASDRIFTLVDFERGTLAVTRFAKGTSLGIDDLDLILCYTLLGRAFSVDFFTWTDPDTNIVHDTVAVERDQLDRLEKASRKLARLEGAGVDNWEGYDEAMRDEES
jgi:hypothetical protein